jgi:hypothetical protein
MKSIIDTLDRLIRREAWTAFYRKKRKNPLNTRDFLWRVIRLYAMRASMPSWGLPFEAIAASVLLKDRDKKKSRKKPLTPDLPA